MRRILYYHIAGMNHWREVVAEQTRVLRGFPGLIKVGLIAGQWEDGYLARVMRANRLDWELVHHVEGLGQYEFPTLAILEADCRAGQTDEVLYFHTKGVSHPGNWHTLMRRWQMNADLLLRANDPGLLADCDHCGSSWTTHFPDFPYYEGNFWAARSSYIRTLPSLDEFTAAAADKPGRPPWLSERHCAELWIGQAAAPPPRSLDRENSCYYKFETFADDTARQDYLHGVHA